MLAAVETALERIETEWTPTARSALETVMRQHPGERVYAAAFWLLYADYSKILVPAFGANAESSVEIQRFKKESWSTRWVPAEWRWSVLDDACDAMKPHYGELSSAMEGATKQEWDELLVAHDALLARVARVLTAELHRHAKELSLPDDFVVAVLDDQREPDEATELLRASIDPSLLARLHGIVPTAT